MDHAVIDHHGSTCRKHSIDVSLKNYCISPRNHDNTNGDGLVTNHAESLTVHHSQTCAIPNAMEVSTANCVPNRKAKRTHQYMATIKEETRYAIDREGNSIPCVSLRTIASAVTLAMSIINNTKRRTRKRITVSDSIQHMIMLIQYGNMKEKEIGACALHRLAVDSKNRSLIAQRGGIPPLLDLIENGTISQKNQAIAATVALTVRNDRNKIFVTQAGGILPLLQLTKKGTDKQKSLALRALYCLAKHEKIRDEISRRGGIPSIVELVKDAGTSSDLKRIAAATFELFSTHNHQ